MTDTLAVLEAQRAQTQLQISRLGDMRSGSITSPVDDAATPAATATSLMILVMVRSIA
jgi:uncharacterized protein YejL (UPF0352 family)